MDAIKVIDVTFITSEGGGERKACVLLRLLLSVNFNYMLKLLKLYDPRFFWRAAHRQSSPW
jgi:hypothetical protein